LFLKRNKEKGVADVIGALFFIIVFASAFSILLATGSYFANSFAYHDTLEYEAQFNKQNISVSYVEALPPSGKSGIIVFNYGIPVIIEDVVIEQNRSLSFQHVGITLGTGQYTTFPTGTSDSGVLTNYGALFMASTKTQLVTISIIGLGVELSKSGGVYYVPAGSGPWIVYANHSARWYVNGSDWGAGKYIVISQINGPTTISAIRTPGYGNPPEKFLFSKSNFTFFIRGHIHKGQVIYKLKT